MSENSDNILGVIDGIVFDGWFKASTSQAFTKARQHVVF